MTRKFETLREVTDNWNVEYRFPNHVYLVSGFKMYGYQKFGQGQPILFNHPMLLDKRYRKFERIPNYMSPFKDLLKNLS